MRQLVDTNIFIYSSDGTLLKTVDLEQQASELYSKVLERVRELFKDTATPTIPGHLAHHLVNECFFRLNDILKNAATGKPGTNKTSESGEATTLLTMYCVRAKLFKETEGLDKHQSEALAHENITKIQLELIEQLMVAANEKNGSKIFNA